MIKREGYFFENSLAQNTDQTIEDAENAVSESTLLTTVLNSCFHAGSNAILWNPSITLPFTSTRTGADQPSFSTFLLRIYSSMFFVRALLLCMEFDGKSYRKGYQNPISSQKALNLSSDLGLNPMRK